MEPFKTLRFLYKHFLIFISSFFNMICLMNIYLLLELVLKIRIANSADPDFVEVELPRNELTLQSSFVPVSQGTGAQFTSSPEIKKITQH